MHTDPIVLREKILVCGGFTEVHTINRVKPPISLSCVIGFFSVVTGVCNGEVIKTI